MVELWAVYDELGVSWEADIRRLVMESNSQAVVDLLKSATRRDSINLVDDSKLTISTIAGGRAVCGARCQFCGFCHGQIHQGFTSRHSFISTVPCFEVEEEPSTTTKVLKSKPNSMVTSTVEEEEGIESVMTFLRVETMKEFSCSSERRRSGDGGNVIEDGATVNRYLFFA
ncbi:hypothetical protein J1N35_035600 [Gossypium stocksii]|uniref:RNase H type-1 domain-containing protein n=1 Tax=Gossypium stocksii TaxID=47602 RepID=A0A9D3ZRT9_9ROSI|nr:hypothetical protein J1N35_035600 [Gossypium stocksii]